METDAFEQKHNCFLDVFFKEYVSSCADPLLTCTVQESLKQPLFFVTNETFLYTFDLPRMKRGLKFLMLTDGTFFLDVDNGAVWCLSDDKFVRTGTTFVRWLKRYS